MPLRVMIRIVPLVVVTIAAWQLHLLSGTAGSTIEAVLR